MLKTNLAFKGATNHFSSLGALEPKRLRTTRLNICKCHWSHRIFLKFAKVVHEKVFGVFVESAPKHLNHFWVLDDDEEHKRIPMT